MNGKTHTAVGVATALAVPALTGASYESIPAFVMYAGVAAFAAVMPDIDIPSSKNASRYVSVAYIGITGMLILALLNLAGYNPLNLQSFNSKTVVGLVALGVLVIFGSKRPHREFTHSIVALILFTTAFHFIMPGYALSFGLAYGSHIVADLFNKKDVHLLWPCSFGNVCFGVCYADGIASTVLTLTSYFVIAIVICFRVVPV